MISAKVGECEYEKNIIIIIITLFTALCSVAAPVIGIVSLNNQPIYMDTFLRASQIEKIEVSCDNYPDGILKVTYPKDETDNNNPILQAISLSIMKKVKKQLYSGNNIIITITYTDNAKVEIELIGSGKVMVDGRHYSANSYLYNTAHDILFTK